MCSDTNGNGNMMQNESMIGRSDFAPQEIEK